MKALVIGQGSIGQRHARLLGELGLAVATVSGRAEVGPGRYRELSAALDDWQPDYVVVANDTADHASTLNSLAGFAGLVLVEKPLFAQVAPLPTGLRGFVGYNLRFHPLLRSLRQRLDGLRLISLTATVGQYLPNWRPGSDYRQGNSASRARGGGVLRDLSHELDYLLWLGGDWQAVAALGGRFSSLEIDSDDVFQLLLAGQRCPVVSARLDYLEHDVRRELAVLADGYSFLLDFVAGRLVSNGTVELCMTGRDDTYLAQHRALLAGEHAELCSLEQGLSVVRLIEAAETAARERRWVNNDG
ncbi:Gfo/Idh/MocA family protein [Chitinimonas lacunae]|uniref:Gfo/Idh/MocA family protein n=1 Tax=Chitinimonas lacunae TaxID=1963018 RepID=A0ABV8MX79_9NEIS